LKPKWCIDEPQTTHIHRIDHDLKLGGIHHSLYLNVFDDWWEGCINVAKNPKPFKKEY